MKKLASIFLAIAILVSIFPAFPQEASAASVTWPELSSGSYATYIAPAGTNSVYRNTSMTIRGSVNPKRTYNSRIDAGDELRLLGFVNGGKGIIVSYPAGNTRRTAIVPTKTLLGASKPQESFTAKVSVSVYKIVNGKVTRWGSTSVGDRIIRFGTLKGGEYILAFYSAVSGCRQWKVGFFRAADFQRIKNDPTPAPQNTNMSYALYKSASGRISCGFDGYINTKGRHEGIDFVKGYGSSVYSLTDGVVIRVTEGYNGSRGLSTIAIYSPSTNKTVIYLHTNPENSLYVGQTISKGQKIATEAWRGCSSRSGTHTHVEVRNGRKTSAAVSVGDYTLSNTNPSSFWKGQGYIVK